MQRLSGVKASSKKMFNSKFCTSYLADHQYPEIAKKISDSICQYFSHTQNIWLNNKAQTMTNIKSKTVLVLIYDQHHKLDNVGLGNLSQYQPSFFCFNKKDVRSRYLICKTCKTKEILKMLIGRAETKVRLTPFLVSSAYPSHSRNVNCSVCQRICVKSELMTTNKHCQQEQRTQDINLAWFSALTRPTNCGTDFYFAWTVPGDCSPEGTEPGVGYVYKFRKTILLYTQYVQPPISSIFGPICMQFWFHS